MAYRRMGAVDDWKVVLATGIDGVSSAPNFVGVDRSSNFEIDLLGTGLTTSLPVPYATPTGPGILARPPSGVPELLARPAETGGSGGTPWLLFAGLGLVAYLFMK
jgi:hypothetical protein